MLKPPGIMNKDETESRDISKKCLEGGCVWAWEEERAKEESQSYIQLRQLEIF